MRRIGVRELRQNASKYLKEVKSGETIEVTDRGQPMALLVPPKDTAWYDSMVARGEIIPAKNPGRLRDLPPPPAADPNFPSASEILEYMRADIIGRPQDEEEPW
jgi:prevent-host-death family protein